jgi:hypothetical protein
MIHLTTLYRFKTFCFEVAEHYNFLSFAEYSNFIESFADNFKPRIS